ncbi:putative acriflavine sensitivity control protein acr-2 [Rosellinia necatrix]|uniref:Putative acriflavine sensitivity control protein acr-2 n=1 Tax=Rosellinia necatrix TaxID=77044 RepID=A0A1W2TCU8_ROSNE|nr:putative acriflavine sensitivity control protein acr-2 [Rosellinia necatrix]
METVRRTQGCWTCKKRKIGCDRSYPACNNCLRTGRECMGYGIRLAWPDQPDGRRRGNRIPDRVIHCSPHNPAHYGKQFLNMTYQDVIHSGKGLDGVSFLNSRPRPARSIPLFANFHERDGHLLRYYHDRLSQMISTINVANGFRDDLMPMALYSNGEASYGLRNAMLAVSAFHLWGSEHALAYKHEAIKSLGSSLSTGSFDTTETQLATSMMLCVYNVFDETEGNWGVHLSGAQKILHRLANIHGGYLAYRFLYTWFLYHEVLGGFSQPLDQWPDGPVSLQLLRDTDFDTSMIIGSLGCSVEVMQVISHVNHWRATELRGDPTLFPEQNRAMQYKTLESKLSSLIQRLDPRHEAHLSRYDCTRTLATAELYRLAAFLYLHSVGSTETSHDIKSGYLQQALHILDSLKVCTSPWPLFVIACEVETDDQRIHILQTLDRMDEERHIGNVFVLRHIIESFWKQQDLQADSGRASSSKWWDVIDLKLSTPWFI